MADTNKYVTSNVKAIFLKIRKGPYVLFWMNGQICFTHFWLRMASVPLAFKLFCSTWFLNMFREIAYTYSSICLNMLVRTNTAVKKYDFVHLFLLDALLDGVDDGTDGVEGVDDGADD